MNPNKQIARQSVSILLALGLILMSCQRNSGYGELVGVQDRNRVQAPIPYGMVYVPSGYTTVGTGGEDPTYSMITSPKTVSISAFYMDETEITNNKYRQFVSWVIDSLKYRLLGEVDPIFLIEDPNGEDVIPAINWNARPKKWTPEYEEAIQELYTPADERFRHRKEIDTRKLNYEYYTFDYTSAARKSWEEPSEEANRYEGVNMASFVNRPQSLKSRAGYIQKHVVNVYPDTLCWIVDFSYSYNDPMVRSYYSSPMYDNYPVVGVNWHQAQAFCEWRTVTHNAELSRRGITELEQYRLPTETEWEFAARGGLDLSPYPWGGPYAMNMNGCLIGNFKPQRGKYALDGGIYPVIVAHYAPNDYGLYDMMGNVAEWCVDKYDDSYEALHDFNPANTYDAKSDDPVALKRKVIRGGSFKDFAENCKVYARHYEYQDTCKSYIGFRCVMSYLGRDMNDNMRTASNIYR
ncbi:MAG: formylglycine-generating enzyme family protein [Bacteroidales bacterium]|jgi:formylglycine-generating enzyme required for sulfatase activity|nr:formylglycine-generating enzyme family protein [Bacteroidales bacterium]